MIRKFETWRERGTRFQPPLTPSDTLAALRRLQALEPVLIGDVVLMVEQCDWPYPFNTGHQIFGENGLGRIIQDDDNLDHGGPLQPEQLRLAVKWAEFQALHPDMSEDAKHDAGRD